jgi:hypothetical protein
MFYPIFRHDHRQLSSTFYPQISLVYKPTSMHIDVAIYVCRRAGAALFFCLPNKGRSWTAVRGETLRDARGNFLDLISAWMLPYLPAGPMDCVLRNLYLISNGLITK